MKEIIYLFATAAWFIGMALAAGWWKILAVVFPPYSFYLIAEWFTRTHM